MNESNFDLSNQVIVLIGSEGQIGQSICSALNQCHSKIIRVDNKPINEPGYFQCDITAEEEVANTTGAIVEQYGRIDGAVNIAHFKGPTELTPGSGFFESLEDYPIEMWQQALDVNLTGLFLCTKHIGKQMLKQGDGVFVNFSSTYGLVSPDPSIYGDSGINSPIAYATTKAGIINFTRYIAGHWGCFGIRANCIAPGGVKHPNQSSDFQSNYAQKTMLKRMARTSEYDAAVIYLLSGASSYMTGACLTIDGGWTAW